MTAYLRLSDNNEISNWRISTFKFKSSNWLWMTAFEMIFNFNFFMNFNCWHDEQTDEIKNNDNEIKTAITKSSNECEQIYVTNRDTADDVTVVASLGWALPTAS